MRVYVDRVVSDEGTLVLFAGDNDAAEMVTFAVDHRMAQHLADALGTDRDDEPIEVDIDDWQVVRVVQP